MTKFKQPKNLYFYDMGCDTPVILPVIGRLEAIDHTPGNCLIRVEYCGERFIEGEDGTVTREDKHMLCYYSAEPSSVKGDKLDCSFALKMVFDGIVCRACHVKNLGVK